MSDQDRLDPIPETQIDELWRSLRRHVSSRLRRADQADDVVQDTWLRLLSRPPARRDRLRGWLRVVAERLVLESSRRRRNRQRREQAAARAEVDESRSADAVEEQGAVLRLLEDLREPYREVVRLRYVDDLETSEIATRLGRAEATVRSQLKRGLDLLRSRLGVAEDPASGTSRRRRLPMLIPFLGRGRGGSGALRRAAVPACAAGLFGVLVVVWFRSPEGAWDRVEPDLAFAAVGAGRPLDGSELLDGAERDLAGDRLPLTSVRPSTAAALGSTAAATELRGRVVGDRRGNPLAGARILAFRDPDALPDVVAVSGADGSFRAQLAELPVWIGAEHDASSPTRRKWVGRGFATSGEELRLESLEEGRVTGIVVTPHGAPIADAEVRFGSSLLVVRPVRGSQGLNELPPGTLRTRTDAAGRFSLPVRKGRGVLEVSHAGYGATSHRLDDETQEFRFVLDGSRAASFLDARSGSASVDSGARGSGVIRGRLKRGEGEPGGPTVDLRLEGESLVAPILATPDDSRFEFESLPAGRFELLVEGGGAHGAWLAAEVVLAPGEVEDLDELTLPGHGGLRLHTEVQQGRGMRSGRLTLSNRHVALDMHLASEAAGIALDATGRVVELRAIWPGRYVVGFHGRNFADACTEVTIEPYLVTETTLNVLPGKALLLRAEFARGLAPAEIVELRLLSSAGAEVRAHHGVAETLEVGNIRTFHLGVADDVLRVEARTTGGLAGAVDLDPRNDASHRRAVVRLGEPAKEGR